MSIPKTTLSLDIRIGGLGDNWMRIVGFYAVAAMRPHIKLRLLVRSNLVDATRHAFGDRVDILDHEDTDSVTYVVRGIRNLIVPAIRGKRFVSPYGRSMILDWQQWTIKDHLNSSAYFLCDKTGFVSSPSWASLNYYQGYFEAAAIPILKDLDAEKFNGQVIKDYAVIYSRLQNLPCSPQFLLPTNLQDHVLIFPSGTGHQNAPLEWACNYHADAIYAFYHGDPDLLRWREAGLQTTVYYDEPGDMIALAAAAKVTVSTDSFPSHILQYSAPRCIVLLTEASRHRVISPAFSGIVIPSVAPCHPCPHLARGISTTCKAGHLFCLNWESPEYNRLINRALSTFAKEQ